MGVYLKFGIKHQWDDVLSFDTNYSRMSSQWDHLA